MTSVLEARCMRNADVTPEQQAVNRRHTSSPTPKQIPVAVVRVNACSRVGRATLVDSRIQRDTNHSRFRPPRTGTRVGRPVRKRRSGGGLSEIWNPASIALASRPDTDSDARFVQRFRSGRIVSSQPLHSEPLLIIDDRDAVLTALGRFFGLYFERIYVATTPQEAEVMLETHHPAVLLCDYWLGDRHPVGTELIRAWRERYPCIKRVVLMSGTHASSLGDVSCADAVVQKPLNLKVVTAFLLGKAAKVEPQH
jgi:hypothetical protein